MTMSLTNGQSDQSKEMTYCLEPKHIIFLCHSGAQKDFTEELCRDLEALHYTPFFDKRPDSLPKGENFPSLIFKAAQQCRVAILVLSDEFFTRSKWPVLELITFIRAQKSTNPTLKIFPLYFQISVAEFKNLTNRERWRRHVCEDTNNINVEEWMEAVKVLESINGIEYHKGDGDVDTYRSKVVAAICRLIPPNIYDDVSHIQAMTQLCEPILQKLREVRATYELGAHVVGLWGSAGMGKTTITKALCHEMFKDFVGKVCHVELDQTGKNQVKLLKKVLQRLTSADETILQNMEEDQLGGLLKQRMAHHNRVFLVLDNVWEGDKNGNVGQAKIFLRANYQTGSKVLVTSRSLGALQSLSITESDCIQMPELKEDDATNLFVQYAAPFWPLTSIDKEIIKICTNQCFFSKRGLGGVKDHVDENQYVPLALKAWGSQLRSINEDPSKWYGAMMTLESHKFNISNEPQHPMFSLLRQGYDALGKKEQHIFLDLALCIPEREHYDNDTKHVLRWLSNIYKTNQHDIERCINAIRKKALLEELNEDDFGIKIHDLYLDFAKYVAQEGPFDGRRFVYDVCGDHIPPHLLTTPSGRCWSNLQRVIIRESKVGSLKRAKFQYCPNVEVFILLRCYKLEEVDVGGMENLISLEVYGGMKLRENFKGVEKLQNLVRFQWKQMPRKPPTSILNNLSALTTLEVLQLSGEFNVSELLSAPNLSGCLNLRELNMSTHGTMKNFPNLSKLTNLQHVNFSECFHAQGFLDLSFLLELKTLNFSRCCDMSGNLMEMSSLKNLELLNLDKCISVHDLSCLCELTALQSLVCCETNIIELPDLRESKKLQNLYVSHCKRLRSLVGIQHATSLRYVYAFNCQMLEELPDFTNLTKLKGFNLRCVSSCTTLPKGFERLMRDRILSLHGCWGLVEPLLDMLREVILEKRHNVLRSSQIDGDTSGMSLNEGHSIEQHECLRTKGFFGAFYLQQIFTLLPWDSRLFSYDIRRVILSLDMEFVIRAFCEHDDLHPLLYVFGKVATHNRHWAILTTPSILHSLAYRIAQHFHQQIESSGGKLKKYELYESNDTYDIYDFLQHLWHLTTNNKMAKALKLQGICSLLQSYKQNPHIGDGQRELDVNELVKNIEERLNKVQAYDLLEQFHM